MSILLRSALFYLHTAGCVGVAKRSFQQALGVDLERGEGTLDLSCLGRTAFPARELVTLRNEITQGEAYFDDLYNWDTKEEIKINLGMLQRNKSKTSIEILIINYKKTKPSKRKYPLDPVSSDFSQNKESKL